MWKSVKLGFELLPLVIALALASYVVSLDMVGSGVKVRTLTSLILFLLVLLIIHALVERLVSLRRMEENTSSLARFASSLQSGLLARYFLRDRESFPPLSERLAGAKTLWVFGVSMEPITKHQAAPIISSLSSGTEMRFLTLKPTSVSVDARAFGLFQADTGEALRDDIRRAIDRLGNMKEWWRKHNQVEVRVTDYVPGFALFIVDAEESSGEIVVELYPYRSTGEARPHFELRPEDGHWYKYFLDQFKSMWNDAEEWDWESQRRGKLFGRRSKRLATER